MAAAFEHRGKVKFYNAERAFGFLTLDSGEQIFFHISAFSKNVTPAPDMRIRCDKVDSEKGPRATRVALD